MTKGDTILRLLTEIKLDLKETKEAIERLDERLDKIEKQTPSPKPSKSASKIQTEKGWKYPSKVK